MDLRRMYGPLLPVLPTLWLLLSSTLSTTGRLNWEIQRYDGWYNNLAYHCRGAAGTPLKRNLPAQYSDGVYKPLELPNPRKISNLAMSGPSGLPSARNRTALSVFFGLHLVSEVLDSRRPGCPPEYMAIEVPPGDPVFDPNSTGIVFLPFQRGEWDHNTGSSPNNPRTPINHVTAWIDGSSIYGPSSSWCDALRSFEGGWLACGPELGLPKQTTGVWNFMWRSSDPTSGNHNPQGLYELGNAWGNENVFMVAEGVIWFRYHNYVAAQLKKTYNRWSEEELFQNARKKVIATLQNIAFYEWLPAFLGKKAPAYPGYQKHIDPGISPEFAAAVRFISSMVPPGVYMRNNKCDFRKIFGPDGVFPALRLCNSFWNRDNPDLQTSQDVDDLLMGMASQIVEREDNIIVEDLRDYMYGPLRFSRSDLVALTIQRGRDHGLPSYNQARESFGLPALNTWEEINPELNQSNPKMIRQLAELYGNDISKLELFPGGLLESNGDPGPLFSAVILDQFMRIRDGDRFWFENKHNGLFTVEEILAIRNTTFHDIVVAVTSAGSGDVQKNVFFWQEGDPCPQPGQVAAAGLAPCTNATTFTYFKGSQGGFGSTVVALFLLPAVSFLLAYAVAYYRKTRFKKFQRKQGAASSTQEASGEITACEWQGPKRQMRRVGLTTDNAGGLLVLDSAGHTLRSLSLVSQGPLEVLLSSDRHQRALMLKIPKEYDLVLLFEDESKRADFMSLMRSKGMGGEQGLQVWNMPEVHLLEEAVTKEQRAKFVETFFRHAFSQILEIDKSNAGDLSKISLQRRKEALKCEVSRIEFANALGLKPDSLFMDSMFTLADKDGNGYLSFQEFLDVIIIFMKGSPEEKSKMMFAMYDVSGNGFLSKEEFSVLLRSFIEISNCLTKRQGEEAIQALMQMSGCQDKEQITWADFHSLLCDHEKELQYATFNIVGMETRCRTKFNRFDRVSFITREKSDSQYQRDDDGFSKREGQQLCSRNRIENKTGVHVPNIYVAPQRKRFIRSVVHQKIQQFKRFVENYKRHIVFASIFYGITAGVTLERCYYYSLQADSTGIPETTAVGIVVSRGSAAAISFLFPYMLLTVSRNLITLCRETFLNCYIPFDAAIDFHRLLAMSAIILTVIHCLGHMVNVYLLALSDLSILSCLFPKVFQNDGSEIPQRWTWWFFQTVPGLTGIILLFFLAIIYVFATGYFRRISFKAFWLTHYLYVFIYILTIIHGTFGLIQEPRFYIFLIPPAVLFLVDKLISLKRKKVEIPVLKAELLPSGVVHLVFKRPQGFVYRSGQWVRIACLGLSTDEYHPFTLTSAPHEETLSLHIRAVGPWTSRLRETYSPQKKEQPEMYPKLYLDGPFGEGHQEWMNFEVSVLVGGGIGVTPFASILKDLAFKSSVKHKIHCKKVYFIWVTRTQHQFEWVSDIIKEVEDKDDQELVSVHTYITQLAEKFDLRTTMLYVFERHFQKILNRSLFTGLRSVTHFGRPPFLAFFNSLQEVHPEVSKIGVFSCGPPGLTKNVETACRQMNRRDQTCFTHHYKNF